MPLVACCPLQHSWWSWIYPGLVLELSSLDLGEIAEALADQTDYEHR
jgi:ABC-type dipeptide/oligopeptide/nickel transport system permease subunit